MRLPHFSNPSSDDRSARLAECVEDRNRGGSRPHGRGRKLQLFKLLKRGPEHLGPLARRCEPRRLGSKSADI